MSWERGKPQVQTDLNSNWNTKTMLLFLNRLEPCDSSYIVVTIWILHFVICGEQDLTSTRGRVLNKDSSTNHLFFLNKQVMTFYAKKWIISCEPPEDVKCNNFWAAHPFTSEKDGLVTWQMSVNLYLTPTWCVDGNATLCDTVTVLTVKFPALMTCLVPNLSTLMGKQVEKLLYWGIMLLGKT